ARRAGELPRGGGGAGGRGEESPRGGPAGGRRIGGAEAEAAPRAPAHVDGAIFFLHYARAFVGASRPPANTMSRSRGVSTQDAVNATPVRVFTTRTRAPAASDARRSSSRSRSSRSIASYAAESSKVNGTTPQFTTL